MLPTHRQRCIGKNDLFLMEILHWGEKHISRTQEAVCLIIELFPNVGCGKYKKAK